MKFLIKAFVFFVCTIHLSNQEANAQIFEKSRGKNVMELISQKTYVFTGNDTGYSKRLKNAFKEYWKISPYEFINAYDGSSSILPSGRVAFMPAIMTVEFQNHFDNNYTKSGVLTPFYVYGEMGSRGLLNGEAMVARFPINGLHYEFNVTSKENQFDKASLRMPYIVYNLNDMLTYLKTNKNEKGYESYIDEKSKRIGTKTLLIPADLVTEWNIIPNINALYGTKRSKPYMASVINKDNISYAGKYLIKTTEEIIQLEQSADAGNYALFLPAIDDTKYFIVYDLKTKELLYYEYTKMSTTIKGKDFNKLNKAAGL